jgi:hypothetical protein
MSWEMNEQEYLSVLKLANERRYEYFVKKTADQGMVWSLRSEGGWVLAGDDEGRLMVPVWPHGRFAQACASGDWEGHDACAIELDAWLERWIPGMQRDQRLVAVFPTPQVRAMVVPPDRLREDLEEELALYE